MFTFGFTTPIDWLSWTIVLALGAKLAATLTILAVNKDARDQPGWGSTLWWVTKVTPLAAVACLAGIATLERDKGLGWLAGGMGLSSSSGYL